MNSQTVDYIFPFSSKFTFHTDLSMIVVSEGRKGAFFQVIPEIGFLVPYHRSVVLMPSHRLALTFLSDVPLPRLVFTNLETSSLFPRRRTWQFIVPTSLRVKR